MKRQVSTFHSLLKIYVILNTVNISFKTVNIVKHSRD